MDAFVLPSAKVRPSVFLQIRALLKLATWLAIAALAAAFMIAPRDSLIKALTVVKIVNEGWHDFFKPEQPKKPNADTTAGTDGEDTGTHTGKPGVKGSGSQSPVASAAKENTTDKGTVGSTANSKGAQATAAGQTTPQATGGPMVLNTSQANGLPPLPKTGINIIVPPGSGQGRAVQSPQGPAPSSIIINNNGSGDGDPAGLPPVTITQIGNSTGEPLPPAGEGTGTGQPPPTLIINGQVVPTSNVVINGQGQLQPTGQAGNVGGNNGDEAAAAGIHRVSGNPNEFTRQDWPRQVAVRGTPAVMNLERSNGSQHEYAVQTDHYEFVSENKLGADVVRELARVFEATYELNKALPLGLHPAPEQNRPRFVARIFSHDSDYFDAGGMKGSAGTYSREKACVLVPASSMGVKLVNGRVQTDRTEATETLVHEITHQMMNRWLPNLPRWYAEGSAEYVAMADYLHGRFFLTQMGDRLRLYLRRRGQSQYEVKMLRPSQLMAMDGGAWGSAVANNASKASLNYASATLLTYYFYHLDGNGDCAAMLKYLRAIDHGTPEPEALKLLLGDRSMADLETDLVNAYDRTGLTVTLVSGHAVATK